MKIKGKPYKAAYKLGKELLKYYKDKGNGICTYGAVGTHGGEDRKSGDECYAGLATLKADVKSLVVDVPYHFEGNITNRIAKKWIRYILEQSPFKSTFAEDRINAGWRRGYYIFNADVDANLLCAALVAIRSMSEYPKIPVMFDKLTKAGADPDMAFFSAYMTGVDRAGRFFINTTTEEGHVAMVPSWFEDSNLANFIKANFDPYGLYSEMNSYRSFNTMWYNEIDGHSWGGRDGVLQPDGVPIRIDNLWNTVLREHSESETRVALFDHVFNMRRNKAIGNMEATKALPLFAKLLNEYRGGLNL